MTDSVTEKLASASLEDGAPRTESIPSPDAQLSLRAIVSTRDAGIIIGKGGKNVAELREQTGVKAGVSKAVPGVVDRILSVTGSAEAISKAYTLITTNLLEASGTEGTQVPSTTIATSIATVVRLLVAHSLMGSIIGKAGAKIMQIQADSNARMVAMKDMLPQSTERIVEVSGTPVAIGTAIKEIAGCLLADQDRLAGTVFFNPSATLQDGYAPLIHLSGYGGPLPPPVPGAYPVQPMLFQGARSARRVSGSASTRGSPSANGVAGADSRRSYTNQNNAGSAAPYERTGLIAGLKPDDPNLRTQNISFPTDMIGCIIGRGGSKIQEIRKLSGSRINISKEPNPETGERLFSIVGTTETNEKALFLLYSSLEAEKVRRAQDDGSVEAPLPA